MRRARHWWSLVGLVGMVWTGSWAVAQEDVADVPAEDIRIGDDEHQRYFLIGLGDKNKEPAKGYGLVIVMPGGDGSADFHPFVKRIFKHALPKGYLVAQPVAVKWTDAQQIVWPTEKSPVDEMGFTTEAFVQAVIDDVGGRVKVNPARVFTLSWSSSGPAAYAISLASDQVTGSLIAMSVYKPDQLPPRDQAKDHAYFLYHSPEDEVCPYRMTKLAADELKQHGAKTKLVTYGGGHGWRGPLYDDLRDGIKWLEKNSTAPKTTSVDQ